MGRSRQERFRLGTLLVLVCAFFGVAVARLSQFQIVKHAEYSHLVGVQTQGRVQIPAERGRIYDRFGTVVADNVAAYSLYAYPIDREQIDQAGSYLRRLKGTTNDRAKRQVVLEAERFRWIDRHVSDDLARQIRANAPPGLYLRKETQRIYPFSPCGQQVLGFTNIDHCGLAGIELSFDSLLAGTEGSADIRRDGRRNVFRVEERALLRPQPGRSLVLTIDWQLQDLVERELRRGLGEFNARWGMAIFLDCHTGEILAAAHYDPNETGVDRPVKLRAVTDLLEPGSVFKIVTATALLESGTVAPEDSVYCEQGRWRVNGRILHDDEEHDTLSFAEVIELSSNIGVAKWAIQLGGDRLLRMAQKFGFGEELNVELPGEAGGSIFVPKKWSDYNIAALSIGHSVAATPLQLATAFATIANGGTLVKPSLVLGQITDDGLQIRSTHKNHGKRVISSETAAVLRTLLRGVVERGTAEKTESSIIKIAGKTGTAEVPDFENGGYKRNKFVASFGGFFPADQPRVAGIIILQEPEPIHYGGWTAGPVFRRIAERYLALRPDLFPAQVPSMPQVATQAKDTRLIPDLIGHDPVTAAGIAAQSGVSLVSNSDSGNIVWQFPRAHRLAFADQAVLAVSETPDSANLRMPDLCGLPVRQAAAFLRFAGIKFRISGSGRVVKQSVRPGEQITGKQVCRLECRPT